LAGDEDSGPHDIWMIAILSAEPASLYVYELGKSRGLKIGEPDDERDLAPQKFWVSTSH